MNRTAVLLPLLCAFGASAVSPYIDRVYEYCPAPGQFINELPPYEPGDDANEMALKAEELISGTRNMLVSLGGWGGYIVFGFDHTVENVKGEYDFKILANAFYANANPNPDAPAEGGSCEQGIVMVSADVNGNGRPDDPWYELAGSEYNSPGTIHNYSMTYYKPDENKVRVPMEGYEYLNDLTYIRWTDNHGTDSCMARNVFHDQSYWPQWVGADELTFTGARLADNYAEESGTGTYYVLYAYPWGYVDNHPNSDPRSNFNIDWAVDDKGNPVYLPGIDFVKVYTAVNQYCGWLGETSTEIIGAYDLHVHDAGTDDLRGRSVTVFYSDGALTVYGLPYGGQAGLFDLKGRCLAAFTASQTENRIPLNLPPGVYLFKSPGFNKKLIVK